MNYLRVAAILILHGFKVKPPLLQTHPQMPLGFKMIITVFSGFDNKCLPRREPGSTGTYKKWSLTQWHPAEQPQGLQNQYFLMVPMALTMVIVSLMSFPVGEVTMDMTAPQSKITVHCLALNIYFDHGFLRIDLN